MEELKKMLDIWENGQEVEGFNVSLSDIRECQTIYVELLVGNKPQFINGNVKKILDRCNIAVRERGIGWQVQ